MFLMVSHCIFSANVITSFLLLQNYPSHPHEAHFPIIIVIIIIIISIIISFFVLGMTRIFIINHIFIYNHDLHTNSNLLIFGVSLSLYTLGLSEILHTPFPFANKKIAAEIRNHSINMNTLCLTCMNVHKFVENM